MTTREEVYKALDSERSYQDKKFDKTLSSDRVGDGSRTIDEFVLYISGLAGELVQLASHLSSPDEKLNMVRKIGGLCVQCMEQHGAPKRLP